MREITDEEYENLKDIEARLDEVIMRGKSTPPPNLSQDMIQNTIDLILKYIKTGDKNSS